MRTGSTRRRLTLAVMILSACDQNTNADLGECAESTQRWWPLLPSASWRYEQHEFAADTVSDKYLSVQSDRSMIHGSLGEETAVRTWRADRRRGETEPFEAGWRWFLASDQGFAFRRDIWVETDTVEAPCRALGPQDDVAGCAEVSPLADVTYHPSRLRLDLDPTHLCQRSEWTSEHVERTVEIEEGATRTNDPALEDCGADAWRLDAGGCERHDEPVTDHWDVQYVDHTIDVPAGHFEHCLCVRRRSSSRASDKTYCFAEGVGKVYELDRGALVECLAEYRIDNATNGPPPDWSPDDHPCDENQVEF